jgi:hypothetical protein
MCYFRALIGERCMLDKRCYDRKRKDYISVKS